MCDTGLVFTLGLPSPKSQETWVGDPAEVSVNVTVNGASPSVTDSEKFAMGELLMKTQYRERSGVIFLHFSLPVVSRI